MPTFGQFIGRDALVLGVGVGRGKEHPRFSQTSPHRKEHGLIADGFNRDLEGIDLDSLVGIDAL